MFEKDIGGLNNEIWCFVFGVDYVKGYKYNIKMLWRQDEQIMPY